MPVLLKIALDERQLFVLHLNLWVRIFIFWMITWKVHIKNFYILEHEDHLKENTCTIIRAVSQTSHYVYEIQLLLEKITDKLLFRLGYLADTSSTMKRKGQFRKNNWQYLMPRDSFPAFNWKLKFWKTCFHRELDNIPTQIFFWWVVW